VHEKNEDLRGDLANLMVHKRATADHYYLLKNKGKTAVKTSQQVTKIMRPSPKRQRAAPGSSGESAGTSKRSRNTTEPPSGRHKWTCEEVTALEHAFSAQITHRCITLADVRTIAKEDPLLCDICPIKIRDKVRSYFSNREQETLELPAERETKTEQLARFGIEAPKENAGINYFILSF
jgi:hypothetical protein